MSEAVIYKIRNLVNDKFYVGSTSSKITRWRTHRKKLRAGTHHCHHLQAAWNKYGEEKFLFEVVEVISDVAHLEDAEDSWLVAHVGKPYCYNHGLRARAPMRGRTGEAHPNFGKPLSPQQRALQSAATKRQWYRSDPRTGVKHSDKTKRKISEKVQVALSEGRGGKFIPTSETRKKMSDALKGNQNAKGAKRSDTERAAISERMKGKQLWLGKKHSEETKKKLGKKIVATHVGTEQTKHFDTLSEALRHFDTHMPTLKRALDSQRPISRGKLEGWCFQYV